MSKHTTARSPDYQKFEIDADGHVAFPGERMKAKLQAIPLGDLKGKSVLDVGCDFGFWSFLAANKGARCVVGIDRGRDINGEYCDLIEGNNLVAESFPSLKPCDFKQFNIGKQWPDVGSFDVIFLFSLYHHIFENCGDHESIWFWLWRQCAAGGVVLFENPVDLSDGVANAHITGDKRAQYNGASIIAAASRYFEAEHVGPAIHEVTREVWRFKKKQWSGYKYNRFGSMKAGAGGATKAFLYADSRRCHEIKRALDVFPIPGSLNVHLENGPFRFDEGYYRVKILEVVERLQGFESPWGPRWCRFYPVDVEGVSAPCFILRFEDDEYQSNFVELISSVKIRDHIVGLDIKFSRM